MVKVGGVLSFREERGVSLETQQGKLSFTADSLEHRVCVSEILVAEHRGNASASILNSSIEVNCEGPRSSVQLQLRMSRYLQSLPIKSSRMMTRVTPAGPKFF